MHTIKKFLVLDCAVYSHNFSEGVYNPKQLVTDIYLRDARDDKHFVGAK